MSLIVYEFGDWVVEPHLNRLQRGNVRSQLTPLGMDLLRCLLEHAGEIVTVDELLTTVWSGRVVEPNGVQQQVSYVRQALGDDPKQPRYIETIRKRGYRVVASVRQREVEASRRPLEAPIANVK